MHISFKQIILASLCLGTVSLQSLANICGIVVLDHYECETYDHIVIQTKRGFTLAEVYKGYRNTYEGDLVCGDLHSYGFTQIYDEDGEEIGRLYVDDYLVGESSAAEWCYE